MIAVRIAPKRPPIQYVSVKLEPGPGTYTPRAVGARNAGPVPYFDDVPSREPILSRSRRSDLGPGTYETAPLPKTASYTPRFDRITARDRVGSTQAGDEGPGPGSYSPRPMAVNVPAPRYLTMGARILQLTAKAVTDTPGPGAYDLDPVRIFNDRGFTFPVDDRRLNFAVDRDEHDQRRPATTRASRDFVAENRLIATRSEHQHRLAQRRKQRHEHYDQTMERCRQRKTVPERVAERQADRANRKLFQYHWLVALIQASIWRRWRQVLYEYRQSAEIRRGVLLRRTNLILALRKYVHAFKRHLQLKRRQRSAVQVRRFFTETDCLARSVPVVLVRNFRRAVAIIQRFWLRQLIKIEHQIALVLAQWSGADQLAVRARTGDSTSADTTAALPAPSSWLTTARPFRGGLMERLLGRIAVSDDNDDDGDGDGELIIGEGRRQARRARRQHQIQTKIGVVRAFLIARRHQHWRTLSQWKEHRQQWCAERRSRDSPMDRARKIIQGASGTDAGEVEREFRAAFPRPFFSLTVSGPDLGALVRRSHVEYRRAAIQIDKRRVRVRSPKRSSSFMSQISLNTDR